MLETGLDEEIFAWAYTKALPDSPGFNLPLKGVTKGFLPPSIRCVFALVDLLVVGVANPEGGNEDLGLEAIGAGVTKLDGPG